MSRTGWKSNICCFLKSQYHNSRFMIKFPRHLLQALPWTENCCGTFSHPSRPELLHLYLGLAVSETRGQEWHFCPLRDVKRHPGQTALPQSWQPKRLQTLRGVSRGAKLLWVENRTALHHKHPKNRMFLVPPAPSPIPQQSCTRQAVAE